ncbi:hypothetical protein, partial [Dyadobacter sp.]|uniref:hypothetical protein n=1 Tax=Dyadobacter sp. TaxID=1914288 RepID=UPI003F71DFE3
MREVQPEWVSKALRTNFHKNECQRALYVCGKVFVITPSNDNIYTQVLPKKQNMKKITLMVASM